MSETLRMVLLLTLVIYFIVVVYLLKNKRLALKYTLLWLAMGVIFLIMILFPNVLQLIVYLLGITSTMNGLFTIAIGFILMLCMSLTSIVSRQSQKVKNLTQDNALLEKRVRELEKAINDLGE